MAVHTTVMLSRLTIAVQTTVTLFLLCLVSDDVLSFSIGRRKTRSTDLAQALSILQRQRRRIGDDDYFSSERLLGNEALRLGDVSDWLSESRGSDDVMGVNNAWMSGAGQFRDYGTRGRYNSDDLPFISDIDVPGRGGGAPGRGGGAESYGMTPSKEELDSIFDSDADKSPQFEVNVPEKKKKEEMVNVKENTKTEKKKSTSGEDTTPDGADDISLETLTKEEFKALVKAVKKLEKQATKLDDEMDQSPIASGGNVLVKEEVVKEDQDGQRHVEKNIELVPADDEELDSVFGDSEAPLVEETRVTEVEESDGPGGKVTKTVETDYVPLTPTQERKDAEEIAEEIVSDLENSMGDGDGIKDAAKKRVFDHEELTKDHDQKTDNVEQPKMSRVNQKHLEALENYWLLNNYLDKPSPPMKRSAKRAATLLLDRDDIMPEVAGADEGEDEIYDDGVPDEDEPEVLAELRAGKVPSVEAFVAKILELQDELDQLRIVARLEDLENDELTDALNEATQAQNDGSVSEFEFDALQKAIRIEEALQDVKKRASQGLPDTPVIKRGEPWRRKRGPEVEDGDVTSAHADALPVYSLGPAVNKGPSLTKSDIERLLGESYILEQDEKGSEPRGLDGGVPDRGRSPDIASLFLPRAGQCPSVSRYSTNCELAELYSLPLDHEARALCNLHEMCYACGKTLSVPQDHCDLVYRAAASALCSDKETCVLESEIFLRTMKLKTRYVPHTQPLCHSTCTQEFLGML